VRGIFEGAADDDDDDGGSSGGRGGAAHVRGLAGDASSEHRGRCEETAGDANAFGRDENGSDEEDSSDDEGDVPEEAGAAAAEAVGRNPTPLEPNRSETRTEDEDGDGRPPRNNSNPGMGDEGPRTEGVGQVLQQSRPPQLNLGMDDASS
jgi:hypothetical protein